ncbi:30S ribosomal protein S3 [Anaerococcus sp. NML200574]|uniref:Small ribosomal subunit protein uS3 n=1 Tax=Anaerococcus kampingae TaxID=3115614 RepID=A0ABW9MEX9_9FIRM|nr:MULTISPECIES: 30S ribosomal protein S3 [unclassified Anaerococcus]MCW6678841.1 30S ribosomal protein S3 [Anaerococcus sp. NML200574]MCW6701841.1 30S ribosomal protein S3 [Anaerococcus sp. NML200537]
MGQKVNPKGYRVGVIKDWDSKWFADKKDFSDLLVEDYKIREFIKKTAYDAGIADIEIERAVNNLKVTIFTGKPGMVIGRGGAGVEELKTKLEKIAPGKRIIINVEEIKYQDLSAQLVAENIASQLENRVAFRRAMKQVIGRTMRAGAKGIKTMVSGRVGGADMARSEGYSEGTIPLQTLRANIDYGFAEADTEYGKIGCKVWIYKGEVLPGEKAEREPKLAAPQNNRRRKRNNRRPNKANAKGQN